MKNNNYINHIVIALDSSGSVQTFKDQIIKVFDNQISYLARRSSELNQETRVSVYTFANEAKCVIYDKDVLRLPSIKEFYKPSGNTALIDSVVLALGDLKETPQKYGDHSFLIYVITDGEENYSKNKPEVLNSLIKSAPDNWTLAVFVPDQDGVHEAKKFGFPANNISVWSTTEKGIEEAGSVMQNATESYFKARSSCVRGTKNLFNLDSSGLNKVKNVLTELDPKNYNLFPVHEDGVAIAKFVESWTKAKYRLNSSFFMLSKPETIQSYKQICIMDKTNGKIYSGPQARTALGLPDATVKVNPVSHDKYFIFVQSSSVNRKLVAGTQLLVLN